ncbi:RICIN domain-containing protein, partial [Streptomyces californicus]
MPVPTQELKLEIVNAATGQPLGTKAVPGADGALVVRDHPEGGPRPQQWRLVPAPGPQDEPTYVIRNAVSGKVLDDPAAADRGIRQWDAAANRKSQQWHLVPVDGEAGHYVIEGAAGGTVLDLAEPGPDDTRIVLGEYDDSARSQRWLLVPAEPERTSDLVLSWAPLSHWNSRRSWRLTHDRTALRPTADATPSFSNVLLVLEKFGSDQDAGGWKTDRPDRRPAGQAGWWSGLGDRFLADTTGTGIADIVGLKPAKGAVTCSSRGDGTFEDERVLHPPAPSATPKDLWTLADLTGESRPGVVVLAADGVRVSTQDEGGTFAPAGGELVLKAFGHGPQAGGWLADKHPRFLADTTG